MNILKTIFVGLIGGICSIASANAAVVTEEFKFTSQSYTITGQFKYDGITHVVQDITGNVVAKNSIAFGGAITGLAASPLDANDLPYFPGVDNIFDPASGRFTFYGMLFSFNDGSHYNYGNIFFYDPTLFDPSDAPFPNAGTAFSSFLPDAPSSTTSPDYGPLYSPGELGALELNAVGAIPEPSTWAMVILGFLGVGIWSRSARRTEARRQLLAAPL
ncbi:PEP-CTERM sorting domain-containing protein [Bradyrhizobium symbiodeficiens]|uniref:PEP-CTERM sorting domain-containing protein n=1 Tax=Bradyrhizobium symbiodeficiens TaxID=1404367 RepID=UPI0030D27ABA